MSWYDCIVPVSAKKARAAGATNHAFMFFIPVWVDMDKCRMLAKWPPLDVFLWLFGQLSIALTGGVSLWVGPRIEEEQP